MPSPNANHEVAYFSMEIAIDPALPTYAGGLGILAGDMLRSAADLGVAMVGVTLLYRQGYFLQELTPEGMQRELPLSWRPEDKLELMKPTIVLRLNNRDVLVRAWRFLAQGCSGDVVPVYLLDTACPENHPDDQLLTGQLYSSDPQHRLTQEALLGLGGFYLLQRLGHAHIRRYHLNEGHAALLSLALMEHHLAGRPLNSVTLEDVHEVRRQCVFTTHTPVPAGHDQFPIELVGEVLGDDRAAALERSGGFMHNRLNMTYLALYSSYYINGVAMQHAEVSRGMFPDYPIRAITNGIHVPTWLAPPFVRLFDRHIPEWRKDNLYLRYAIGIDVHEILEAHEQAKAALLAEVKRLTGVALEQSIMTIGFARRAAAYKRADLIFTDLERLRHIDLNRGPLQMIFGGKAHPNDEAGKTQIRHVIESAHLLAPNIEVVYLPNFDWALAPLLYSGVDLWLNTPLRPQEASGTSGMKAAVNGVPSLSVLDGWWVEGCLEGFTGWAIQETVDEASSLYDQLEQKILPLFYGRPLAYAEVMRNAIALNGSFFNTQRVVTQYDANAYSLAPET